MKIPSPLAVATLCATGLIFSSHAFAVTDAEFNALKELVIKQGERIDDLERTNELERKIHQDDQEQINQLKDQLKENQAATATNVSPTAEAAQAQPVASLPAVPPATHNFLLAGDAEIQFGKVDGSHAGFELADFAPIFLYRTGDKILFEAGLDASLQNNATNGPGTTTAIDLSFAQLDYLLSDHVTFVGGYMLLPLGTYAERSAGWLNKIPDDPLPREVVPGVGAGVQLRGVFPIGESGEALTYSIFGVNGPGSADGTDHADALDLGGNVGINTDGTTGNLHGSPGGGGRVGWFYPWKAHYDLELGISGETSTWDNADRRHWSAAVFDAALHLSPDFEMKGEYLHTWAETSDAGTIQPQGWWLQAGYKLAGLGIDAPVINNFELVGRYDTVKDNLAITTRRYTVGYVYYFSNTLLFEGDYEFVNSGDPTQDHNRFVLQLSYGF